MRDVMKAKEECNWCKDNHAKNEHTPNCNGCINHYILDRHLEKERATIKIGRHDAKINTTMEKINRPEESLTLNEYQTLANVTRNRDLLPKSELSNYGLGVTGEAGEVADIIKKHVYHGHPLDRNELIKELGDVMWYIASLASSINVSLEQIACKNVDKLRKRYPEGFDQSKSINRVE